MATQAFVLRAGAFGFHGQRGLSVELGGRNLSGWHRKRKRYLKLASLSNHAAHFDAAMVFFHDSEGAREPETGAIALGGVVRPENIGRVLRRRYHARSLTTTPA